MGGGMTWMALRLRKKMRINSSRTGTTIKSIAMQRDATTTMRTTLTKWADDHDEEDPP
jgi:hypothetical protein